MILHTFICGQWIDGSSYQGQWKGDFMHGEGEKKEKDGRLYDVSDDFHLEVARCE